MNTDTNNKQNIPLKTIDHKSFIKDVQKILKAFYMITDLFPESETIALSIRENTLSLVHKIFAYTRDLDKESLLHAQSYIYEIMSLSDVACSVGLISDMNYQILEKEVKKLEKNIIEHIAVSESDTKSSFLADIFHVDLNLGYTKNNLNLVQKETSLVKHSVSAIYEKKALTNDSKIKQKTQMSLGKKSQKNTLNVSVKGKRHENILSILKQKKNASITDVCSLFKDCSSKTIQRDLKELIKNKKVTKKGERRWAVYNLL